MANFQMKAMLGIESSIMILLSAQTSDEAINEAKSVISTISSVFGMFMLYEVFEDRRTLLATFRVREELHVKLNGTAA